MTAGDWLRSPMIYIFGIAALWWAIGKRGRAAVRALPDAIADAAAWAWSGLTWRRRWRRTPRPTDRRARLVLQHIANTQPAGATAAELHTALGWPAVEVYGLLDALVDTGHLTRCSVPGPGTPRAVYRIPEDPRG
ncbi:hypothetical protein [Streptomyces phytophilus]|uniref:hypothetical protein n=1 Tax=Streptomyces phytophilus TaxID=722715 RepID=UPI0015F06009|nr:hypothetical protein [Streptomyces phytophilus]